MTGMTGAGLTSALIPYSAPILLTGVLASSIGMGVGLPVIATTPVQSSIFFSSPSARTLIDLTVTLLVAVAATVPGTALVTVTVYVNLGPAFLGFVPTLLTFTFPVAGGLTLGQQFGPVTVTPASGVIIAQGDLVELRVTSPAIGESLAIVTLGAGIGYI